MKRLRRRRERERRIDGEGAEGGYRGVWSQQRKCRRDASQTMCLEAPIRGDGPAAVIELRGTSYSSLQHPQYVTRSYALRDSN